MQCTKITKKGERCKNATQTGVCHIHTVKFNIKSSPSPKQKLKVKKMKSPKNEKRDLLMLRKIDRQLERALQRRDAPLQPNRRFVPFFDNIVNAANADEDFDLF